MVAANHTPFSRESSEEQRDPTAESDTDKSATDKDDDRLWSVSNAEVCVNHKDVAQRVATHSH